MNPHPITPEKPVVSEEELQEKNRLDKQKKYERNAESSLLQNQINTLESFVIDHVRRTSDVPIPSEVDFYRTYQMVRSTLNLVGKLGQYITSPPL